MWYASGNRPEQQRISRNREARDENSHLIVNARIKLLKLGFDMELGKDSAATVMSLNASTATLCTCS